MDLHNLPLGPLGHLLIDAIRCLKNRLLHPSLDVMLKFGLRASNFLTLASGTSAADGVEREELRAVLVPR